MFIHLGYRIWMPLITASMLFGAVFVAADDAAPETADVEKEIAITLSPEEEVAVLDTTAGIMVVRFFPDDAPKHVENFKTLCEKRFYDRTKFHRVIKGFMIQGGCPNTKGGPARTWGTGNPGYTVNAEFNDRKHVRGILSMARAADPNSAGSQFFICHGDAPSLNNNYTVFGELVDGLDVLDTIASAPVQRRPTGGEVSLPEEPVEIRRAGIMTWQEYQQARERLQAENAEQNAAEADEETE